MMLRRIVIGAAAASALAPVATPPKRAQFRETGGGGTKEAAVALGQTLPCANAPIGDRDVVARRCAVAPLFQSGLEIRHNFAEMFGSTRAPRCAQSRRLVAGAVLRHLERRAAGP